MKIVANYKSFGRKYLRFLAFRKKNIRTSRFSLNSTYKFTKPYKILDTQNRFKSKDYTISSQSLFSTGMFTQLVICSPKFSYITDFQLKSCKNLIKKPYKKLLSLRIYTFFGVTKKPAEVRMGKGKGSKISYRVFPARAGFLLSSCFRRQNPKVSDLRFTSKAKTYFAKLPIRVSVLHGGCLKLILYPYIYNTSRKIFLKFFMYRGTKCIIIDNSGALVGRVVHSPQMKKAANLGSIVLVSIIKRDFGRRRIRLGQVFRALVLSCGFTTSRLVGHRVSSINTIVLIKKSDVVPISKRVKGPVPLELRRLKRTKFLAMGSYVF